ncbi:hypothetical protein GGP72_003278 [Salinibacter ruber]|uniref:Uncharacterized protein n=1 Tax=Salinibacter ruber TaxID=146919 RepID=A0A9X2Q498_9BACT|nr:hypothetical protein [Salinibacter ruber]MCS3682614.1 hypothetical protein [Salinibacter ruber]
MRHTFGSVFFNHLLCMSHRQVTHSLKISSH